MEAVDSRARRAALGASTHGAADVGVGGAAAAEGVPGAASAGDQVTDGWLLADREVPHKQRHTARRVWQRLVAEHGASLAEVTVSRYVARRRVELVGSGRGRGAADGWPRPTSTSANSM